MLDYTHSNITESWDGATLIVNEEVYTALQRERMRMTSKPDFSLYYIVFGFLASLILFFGPATVAACFSARGARTDAGYALTIAASFACFVVFAAAAIGFVLCAKEAWGVFKAWRTPIPPNAVFVHTESLLIRTLRVEYRGSWYEVVRAILDQTSIGGAYYFAIETYVRQAFHLQEPFTVGTSNASRRPVAKQAMELYAKQCADALTKIGDTDYELTCAETRGKSIPATALFENALQQAQEPVDT